MIGRGNADAGLLRLESTLARLPERLHAGRITAYEYADALHDAGLVLATLTSERSRAEQLLSEARAQFRRAALPDRALAVNRDVTRLGLQ